MYHGDQQGSFTLIFASLGSSLKYNRKHILLHDPLIPFLDIYPKIKNRSSKRYLHDQIHGHIIPNSQKVDTVKCSSIYKQINKMCYICTKEYYSAFKRKEIWNMQQHKSWGYYTKWNKLETKREILYDSIYMWYPVKFLETERRMVVARD